MSASQHTTQHHLEAAQHPTEASRQHDLAAMYQEAGEPQKAREHAKEARE